MRPTDADRDHNDYRDLLGAYAVGAVPPGERRRVAAHLASCAACRAELGRLRAAVDALPLALADREPPPTLRDGIEAVVLRELGGTGQPNAGERPQSVLRGHAVAPLPPGSGANRRSVTPWAAVAALLLAFSLGMLGWNLRLHHTLGQEEAAAAVVLRPARPALLGGGGRLAHSKDHEPMVVAVRGLPPLAPDLIYELWPARRDAVPASPTVQSRTDATLANSEGPPAGVGVGLDVVGSPD